MHERYDSLSRHAGVMLPRTSGILDGGAVVGVLACMDSFMQDGTIPIIHDTYELIGVLVFALGGAGVELLERFSHE